MLHEEFFPDYMKFVPEKAAIFLLGIAMLSLLYFNRNEILRSDYGILLLAYLLLGTSVFLDAIPNRFYDYIEYAEKVEYFLEDGTKFIAIVTWVTFFARYSYQQFSLQIFRKAQSTGTDPAS